MIPPQMAAAARTAVAIYALLLSDPTTHELADESSISISRRLQICSPQSNCVSSNYREPPNRYVSPFKIVNEPDVAFQRAVRDIKAKAATATSAGNSKDDVSILDIVPKQNYIHLTVPGTAPSSLDDIELIFSEDIVNVKCEARVTLPPPPFCIKKNCINGNMDQRSRIEKIGYLLGLPANDREQMQGAKWTPIFMNSDRVPGFDDDVSY
jgi:uncharacterized protein (DUF1499 family)